MFPILQQWFSFKSMLESKTLLRGRWKFSIKKMYVRTITFNSEYNFSEGAWISHGWQSKNLCCPVYMLLFTYVISLDPCKLPMVRSGQLSQLRIWKPGILNDLNWFLPHHTAGSRTQTRLQVYIIISYILP